MYLGVITILSAVGILVTVLLLYMHHMEGSPSVVGFQGVLVKMTRCAAACICSSDKHKLMTSYANRSTLKIAHRDENEKTVEMRGSPKIDIEVLSDVDRERQLITWSEMAAIWDRCMFISFTVATILMNICFLMALTLGEDS